MYITLYLLFFHAMQAGLPTRLSQWWGGVPFITSGVVIVCGVIYLVCLLVGYDSFIEICFLPSAVISRFQGTLMFQLEGLVPFIFAFLPPNHLNCMIWVLMFIGFGNITKFTKI